MALTGSTGSESAFKRLPLRATALYPLRFMGSQILFFPIERRWSHCQTGKWPSSPQKSPTVFQRGFIRSVRLYNRSPRFKRKQGIANLSRAFLFAGARTLIRHTH
jgi:hypothetical protein